MGEKARGPRKGYKDGDLVKIVKTFSDNDYIKGKVGKTFVVDYAWNGPTFAVRAGGLNWTDEEVEFVSDLRTELQRLYNSVLAGEYGEVYGEGEEYIVPIATSIGNILDRYKVEE